MRKRETAVCGTACTVVWEVGKCESRRQMPFMISIYLLPDFNFFCSSLQCTATVFSYSESDAEFVEYFDEFFVHGFAAADGIDEGHIDHFVVSHADHDVSLSSDEGFDGANSDL